MDYRQFIKRVKEPTPENIHIDGKAVFGTFDKEFEKMDFLDIKKPTGAPEWYKKNKLTLWEAVEVNLKDGVLLAAPCDMGLFGTMLVLYYDKQERKVHTFSTFFSSKKVSISKTLLNGDISEAQTKTMGVKVVNNFQDGKATVSGWGKNKQGDSIEYEFELERVSLPSISSMPFGENRPLYSQKDLFKATGKVLFNGKEIASDEGTAAVIDDHRGYYPYRAHYDWLTTMGLCDYDGAKKFFAFNLVRNQSIDQDKYNENLIWLENKDSFLPPVKFEHVDGNEFLWTVKDDYGMVDVTYEIYDRNELVLHAGIIDFRYYVTFGEIKGYLLDVDGNKYVLDGMMGLGEDKTLRF